MVVVVGMLVDGFFFDLVLVGCGVGLVCGYDVVRNILCFIVICGLSIIIQDVVDLVQVLIKMVFCVLNYELGVVVKMCEVVQVVVQMLCYQFNLVVCNLFSVVGNNIVFVFLVLSCWEGKGELVYLMVLQLGVLQVCKWLDFGVLLQFCECKDVQEVVEIVELMQGWWIFGFVVVDFDVQLIQWLQVLGLMFSVINVDDLDGGYLVVVVDDELVVGCVICMLIEWGYCCIGFV